MKLNRYTLLAILMTVIFLAGTQTAHASEKQSIEPPRAWTVSQPLGLRYPATVDTLFENYHRFAIPWLPSIAWATTGNYGAPGQDQIFFNRADASDFFFENAIAPWVHNTEKQQWFNTRIPMTIAGYTTGGDKYSHQDRTQLLFTANAGPRFQAGGAIDYIYSKGSYEYQADKDFTWKLFGSYTGDRYELQTHFTHYDYTNKENGGITDDRYITHPEDVQGGVTRVDNKSIPTHLTSTQNNLKRTQFYLNHRYKLGFYRYRRDSVTDTIIGKTYVPVTSFIHTIDYNNQSHKFINNSGLEDTTFWDKTYLHLGGTDETTRTWRLRNTLGVSMLEGFNRWATFGLGLYATHEVAAYTQATDSISALDTVPKGLDASPGVVPHFHREHRLWLGGQITRQHGSVIRYRATAQFGITGDVAGDIDINGEIETRVRIASDTASLRAYGYFKNLEAPYLLRHFTSNHHIWNNNFGKTRRLRIGGELKIPHTWTTINVGYETLKNYIYFDTLATPVQHTSPMHVFSATVKQDLHWRALGWENTITYQASSDNNALPLPKLALYSNLYAKFRIARVLNVQIGIDCNYYTRYNAPGYDPAIMSFHNQNDTKCGNFLMANIYANFRLKKARFFVTYTHANGKIFGGNDYFAIPHYPLNPRRFQVGVSVNFGN